MVVVRAATFNLISTIGYALWGTTTIQSEKATNLYECGLACDSFADCGGFQWKDGQCQLVARVAEAGEVGTLDSNLYRMTTFRGKRIIDGHREAMQFDYAQYKQACDDFGMMMLPPPMTVREKMTVSIRNGFHMPLGGVLTMTEFTDDFGNTYPLDNAEVTLTPAPTARTTMMRLFRGYVWGSYSAARRSICHLMCVEKD